MITLRTLFARLLCCRNGGIFLFVLVFVGIATGVRFALIYKASASISWDVSLFTTLLWGLLFDIGAASLFSIPLVLLLTALPMHWFAKRWLRVVMNLGGFIILFIILFY